MSRRVGLLVLLSVLVVGFSLSPSLAQNCDRVMDGIILLPLPTPVAPPFHGDDVPSAQGIFVFKLVAIDDGQDFWLYAANGDNMPLGPCVGDSCVFVPDFNVAFYREEGAPLHTQVGPTFASPGPIEGQVPGGADYALVWMHLGADAVGTAPASGEFLFAQGCTARPW